MAIEFKVEAVIALLSEGEHERVELRRVAWNGKPAKLDIRRWLDGGTKPGKGIALTKLEAALLRDELVKMDDLPKPGVDYLTRERSRAAVEAAERAAENTDKN